MVSTPVDVNEILNALETFIKQRPGIDLANYGCHPEQLRYSSREQQKSAIASYRSEVRSIGKDRKRALALLSEVRRFHTHYPDLLIDSFRAYSGRLEWKADRRELEYTTGQYFPTEYRRAAAAVLETYISACNRKWAEENPQTFTYRTIEDVKRANRAVGGHWFDRDTLRFFNTVIESRLVGGRYFVTSERMDDSRPKRYSVRVARPDGTIDTVGKFQQYADLESAREALKTAHLHPKG